MNQGGRRKTIIIPFLDLADMTIQAAEDALNQHLSAGEDIEVILADNGSCPEERARIEAWRESGLVPKLHTKLIAFPLVALGSVWNQALDIAFDHGQRHNVDALIINNDVRIHPWTYDRLRGVMYETDALFVSAVNVGEVPLALPGFSELLASPRGGPDYSCFLVSRDCWLNYQFDEHLTYRGDLDHHRTLMLAGQGRRIFSVPVGYKHLASQTIHRSPEAFQRHCIVDAKHAAYYTEKWGGGTNEELFKEPWSSVAVEGVKTPELQRAVWAEPEAPK